MTDPKQYFPKPDPQQKEWTIRQSVRLYREQAYGEKPRMALGGGWLTQWKPFVAGMAVAAFAFMIYVKEGTAPIAPHAGGNTEALALLSEMKQVFGDKLEGVVEDGGHIEPVVSSGTTFTDAQPVVITLKQGDREIRIISYSGNTVTLSVGGKNLSLSPTVTADGKVIVEGKDFIWSRGKTEGTAPGTIDAKALGKNL